RRYPGMLRRRQIAIVERPGVIAAESFPLLQQQDAQVRPRLVQAPGNQSVGQAAAGQDDVVMHGQRDPSARTGPPLRITCSTLLAAAGVPPAASTAAPRRASRRAKFDSVSRRCSRPPMAPLRQKCGAALSTTPA